MNISYSKPALKALERMEVSTRQRIRLTKFIPEDMPLPDEVAAIAAGREAVQRGEIFRDDEIDWDAPPVT